jgi:hypothetical protein
MKKFVFRSNKYNVTHQDLQRGIEDRGYIDSNPITDSETNPLSKWKKYQGERDDTNLFVSSSNNISRIQIHQAINRLYDSLEFGQVNVSVDVDPTYKVGYNYNKQKFFNYVEEYLVQNPSETLAFVKDPQQFLVTIPGLNVKNILVYQGGSNKTNTTLPFLKTNTGDIVGHHKDGQFERGLQGPFTEANVGGYKHRHQRVGNTTDRPERFKITDDGTTITFSSPISGNTNAPYARFSREGFTKSVVNIANIRATGSFALGNFQRNYEVVSGLHRRAQNLALVDRPQNFQQRAIENPLLTGSSDYAIPDRTLLDGTYNKTVFVNKFGAPGDSKSSTPIHMDFDSEEYSVYNTVNYRNISGRLFLKKNLSTGSYFGGYISGSYGITTSYNKTQRNNRRIPISGTTQFKLRPDNTFFSYGIPARDGGYSWILNYTTGGNNPGLYINGVDNDINFITSSIDGNYFTNLSSSYVTFTTSSVSLNTSTNNVLRKFNVQFSGMWKFTPKKQLSQNYNPIIVRNKARNYFVDYVPDPQTNTRQDIRFKDSFIKDKHTNIVNVYVDENGNEERLSLPFGQEYGSLTSDFYRVETDQNINIYKDYRNIRQSDKSKSLFAKLFKFDRYTKKNNLNIKKIKSIIHEEKIYPRSQNVYRDIARVRNNYSSKWADNLDNRLTELTNSQGQVYVRTAFLNKDSGGTEYKFSYWPMDANEDPTFTGAIVRDKSGELIQLDNINFYFSAYGVNPGLIVPSGSYYGARFGRNWNRNRPANVVHEQAGRGPFKNSYEQFYSDIKLIGQDCSVVPEYRISPRLDTFYSSNISYYSDTFNSLELTGTVVEDASLAISTSSAFLEQRVNSDYIDLNEYLNKELTEFKLNTIKLKVKGIKKFLPYDGFYPQQRMLQLASQFSSSYNGLFTLFGVQSTFRTALTPFYAPGIGFNSIKAGMGMPFNVATASIGSNPFSDITSSIDSASLFYHKLPWDSILYPYKRLQEISGLKIVDIDPDMPINSTASINSNNSSTTQIKYNLAYDYMANNYYSEVIDFFKDSGNLSSLKSRPSNQWYFPDISKRYAMDIVILKQGLYTTYSSHENFGPKPYGFHAPPWNFADLSNATTPGYNSDVSESPNSFRISGQTYAQIIFDPQSLAVGDLDYYLKGKFNIGDVLRNSTVSYTSFMLGNNTSSATVQINDLVDLFSVSADGLTWQPQVKWECPTADLNFYALSAKLTNSSGNDSGGGSNGDAIRGIWHQYASLSNNNDGLFLSVRNSNVNTDLTGSLLDVVGFDKSARTKIGKIASSRVISETLLVIPYYLNDCGEEKYFDIDIDTFERLYTTNTGIVGEMKLISRNYVLPPQMDFIRLRDQTRRRLEKPDYGSIKSPFIMFPFEFKATLTQQDLADIWQGVLPTSADVAEVDYQEKEFFIGNYLKDLNYKLPDNTRFKVFKVKKRAVVNYEEINYKSLGYAYSDTSYGYNWPYDFFSLLEMAEVRAEMTYGTETKEDTSKVDISDITTQQVQTILERSSILGTVSPEVASVLQREIGTLGVISDSEGVDATARLRTGLTLSTADTVLGSADLSTNVATTTIGRTIDITGTTLNTNGGSTSTFMPTSTNSGGSTTTFMPTSTTDTGTNTSG